MPLQIQRTATVYQLWDDSDVQALFEDHAEAGWLCTLTCLKDTVVRWQVSLQNSATRQLVSAPRTDVVVSDLVTVESLTVSAYNTANPAHTIEEPSS